MRTSLVTWTAAALFTAAAIVWHYSKLPTQAVAPDGAIDPDQTAIDRMIERTVRESRTGVVEPATEAPPTAPPAVDSAQQAVATRSEVSEPAAASRGPGAGVDALPDGYTPGTYRGAMQRAPLTSLPAPDPSPNPDWLGADSAPDRILDQAAQSGREFTFAVLRVLPGTDLQVLDRSLGALGARIEGSTGPNVRARVPAQRARLETIARLDGVLGIGAVPPVLKADESFVQEMLARPASEPVPVYITLMAEDTAGDWRRALTELGVTVGAYDRNLRSYAANMPASALADVTGADFVTSVEPVPVVTIAHDSSIPVMGVDGFRRYDPATERFSGITGAGIAVGVIDTALNTRHADIVHGRASICGANFVADEHWDLWFDLNGHGTHVFGTLAGAGRENPVLAGIAPGLSHLRFAKVIQAVRGRGSADDIRRAMDYLSHPTACSWQGALSAAVKPLIVNMSLSRTGLTFSGRGVGERKLDSVVHAHSQLYVVAQANAAQQGFSNYGTAKNSLAVGAVDDSGIIASFSSHGPTADGRLAPNVVGTGVNLTSVRGGAAESGHHTLSGTSMAAPSVAGVAALLMEAQPEFQDRPALSRARLMASAIRPHVYLESRTQLPADNSDGPGAFNNLYGLGLVSARTTLFSRDDPEGWLIGSASSQPQNGSYEYVDIEVPEDAGRLDVVLTWDEQPADTLTRSVLNNLDLWADQGADCEDDACGEYSSRSEVDNVEWLLIDDPVPGTYRIKVVPVETYGETITAAVAWKILRGEPTPQLTVEVEDISSGSDSEYITVEVTVDADRYVAAGTTLSLGCRTRDWCELPRRAYRPHRNRIYREDGLHWPDVESPSFVPTRPIPIGEVAAGAPKRVELQFLRREIRPETFLDVIASSWNARSDAQRLAVGRDAADADSDVLAPANDNFSGSEHIAGVSGATALDFALGSREPGEPRVTATYSTMWYRWEAPVKGLFRFRLQEADSGDPEDADLLLFTGESLVELDLVADKRGAEISFAAQAGSVYRLRVAAASEREDWPPMVLKWESADSRPANDDFAYAQAIEGESGMIESTNQGATLEISEFPGGGASTVWFRWTAPADGWWHFGAHGAVETDVFVGERVDDLRLVSYRYSSAYFPAREGETYRIAVSARSAEHSGSDFTLWWNSTDIVSSRRFADNDLFEGALEIAGASGAVANVFVRGTRLVDFTVEPGEPVETGIGTGWWQWTAPTDGRFTWKMDGPSAYRLTFFTGDALESLQFVGSLSGGSAFILDATGDTRYRIAVGRAPDSILHAGTRMDAFTWGPTPSNDERAAASAIAGTAGSVDAVLAHATPAPRDPADTVGTDSLWWRWSAPASGWQRFWIDGHPLSTIVSVYSDTVPAAAIAHSERSLLANGRVEVHVLAEAGKTYDLRLSSRPGVDGEPSATLRWEASDAPTALAYRGAITIDSFAANPVSQGFHSPRNLVMSDDGNYLFSSAYGGVFAFVRDKETGEIALAHGALGGPDEGTLTPDRLQRARLWWNARDSRLLAQTSADFLSYALPEDGSNLLSRNEITVDGEKPNSGGGYRGAASPDGRHYYTASRATGHLLAYSVDSAEQMTHLQTVSPHAVQGEDALIVPLIGLAVSMAFSADGLNLYVVTGKGLLVFSRDASSGMLALASEIPHSSDPDTPFEVMEILTDASAGGNGAILFVAGRQNRLPFNLAVAAFDIASDPSQPEHLDTFSGMYYRQDLDTFLAWNHVRSTLTRFYGCNDLIPHSGRTAVDILCTEGFFVVEWNPATAALEVTDYAVAGTPDRFGNTLPYHLGWSDQRQMAQSPDGAHVYRATSLQANEYADAIHIFERASAMTPADGSMDTGGELVDPMEPAEPTEPGETPEDGTGTTPEPPAEGECHPGLLVRPGESCTYPGTDDEFTVNERGRGSFLGRLRGIRIRINNETIDGRVYDFLATHQGDGVWRIDRVAGET